MILSGGKLFATLLATLVVGGAIGYGAYSLTEDEEAPPVEVVSPTPSTTPSLTSKPVSESPGQSQVSDREGVLQALRQKIGRAVRANPLVTEGNYAIANAGPTDGPAAMYFLVKRNGDWTVVEAGNGFTDDDTERISAKYGFPDSLWDEYNRQVQTLINQQQ